MQTANVRQRLHQYVDECDDKLIKMMYAIAEEYNGEDDDGYEEFTKEEDTKEFDERRELLLRGAILAIGAKRFVIGNMFLPKLA